MSTEYVSPVRSVAAKVLGISQIKNLTLHPLKLARLKERNWNKVAQCRQGQTLFSGRRRKAFLFSKVNEN